MIFQNPGNIQTGECLNHSLGLGNCSLSVKHKIWGNEQKLFHTWNGWMVSRGDIKQLKFLFFLPQTLFFLSQTNLLFFHLAAISFPAFLQTTTLVTLTFPNDFTCFLTAWFAATMKEFTPSPSSKRRLPTPAIQLEQSR